MGPLEILRAENEPVLEAANTNEPPEAFITARMKMHQFDEQSTLIQGDLKALLDDLHNGFDDLVDLVYDVEANDT